MPDNRLDETDHALLRYLQRHGRASNVQISEQVHLSETPCWRRVRRLEQEGIIEGYRAVLNRGKVGFDILAFVHVVFSVHTDDAPERFEQEVQKIPEILACHNVTGEADYLLIVAAQNLAAYEQLLRTAIRRLPGVTSLTTMLSLREVKGANTFPLPLE